MKKEFNVYCEGGKIVYIDDKILQVFRLSLSDVLGRNFREVFEKYIFEYKNNRAFLINGRKAVWVRIKEKTR